MLESSRDAIFLLWRDGRIQEANAAATALYGYERAELRTLTIADLRAPETRAQLASDGEAADDEGGVLFETVHRRKDGTTFPVEVSARGVSVDGARMIVSVVRDIRSRLRARGAEAEAERKYRGIFEQALEGMYRTSLEGRNLASNPALAKMLGYDSEEEVVAAVTDSAHQIWVDPDERAAFVAKLREQGSVRGYECRYRRKDGSVIWVSMTTRLVRGDDGEPLYTEGFIEDVTERRRIADALRVSEARLAQAVSLANLGVWDWDPASDVTSWNDEMLRIYGITREAFTGNGQDYIAATQPDFRAVQRTNIARAFEAGITESELARGDFAKPEVNELRVVRPDGTVRITMGSAVSVVDGAGKPLRMLGVLQDVTEQRRAEDERAQLETRIAQTQKLESLGRLAGGVAHDFNNLLTVILSCAESLEDDLDLALPANAEEVREIRAAGERAKDLTRQLLTFARKQVIAPVALDLNAVVLGCEKMLRRVLGEEIGLEVRVAAAGCPVRCDRGQLEQVIMNLAVNARDAMPEGGSLVVETRQGQGAGHPETKADASSQRGGWVRLVVTDTGVGIADDVRAHLFEPFFTTKALGHGTGLGLATVDGIVAQNGGHIHVVSAPGQGTTFEICLPRTEEPLAPSQPSRQRSAGRGSELVLVVEDEPRVRAVTVRALRRAGYEVLVAANGEEALGLDRETLERVKLLLTDVVMPGQGGVAIADGLRARHPTLRVLYVSGHPEDAIAHRGVLEPGVEFLPKPFTASSLLGRVRTVLDG
jgi:PAS domain S-box-containing protein